METGAIILSGGRGERLGFKEKGLISFKGEPLILRKVRQLSYRFDQIVVVTNKPQLYAELPPDIRLVKDDKEYQGPLRGLYCGLKAASADLNFVCAVDMPFINYDLIDGYRRRCTDCDAVVGKIDNRIEPMFGFYSKRLIAAIESLFTDPNAGLTRLLEMSKTKYIEEGEIKKLDPELISFANINTEKDMLTCRQGTETSLPFVRGG